MEGAAAVINTSSDNSANRTTNGNNCNSQNATVSENAAASSAGLQSEVFQQAPMRQNAWQEGPIHDANSLLAATTRVASSSNDSNPNPQVLHAALLEEGPTTGLHKNTQVQHCCDSNGFSKSNASKRYVKAMHQDLPTFSGHVARGFREQESN